MARFEIYMSLSALVYGWEVTFVAHLCLLSYHCYPFCGWKATFVVRFMGDKLPLWQIYGPLKLTLWHLFFIGKLPKRSFYVW